MRERRLAIAAALVIELAALGGPTAVAVRDAQAQSVLQSPPSAGLRPSKNRALAPAGTPPGVDVRAPELAPWLLQVLHFVAGLFQVPPGAPPFRDPFNSADPNHPWRASTQ
ncbi:MAG: hypothetical protein HY902_16815 [Deltaproteobacteria bacterium]|nr:hypothetical protein [Deltaproteobacteria bacterium]